MDDVCYECKGLGGDYIYDDEGDLVSACEGCCFNESERNEDD